MQTGQLPAHPDFGPQRCGERVGQGGGAAFQFPVAAVGADEGVIHQGGDDPVMQPRGEVLQGSDRLDLGKVPALVFEEGVHRVVLVGVKHSGPAVDLLADRLIGGYVGVLHRGIKRGPRGGGEVRAEGLVDRGGVGGVAGAGDGDPVDPNEGSTGDVGRPVIESGSVAPRLAGERPVGHRGRVVSHGGGQHVGEEELASTQPQLVGQRQHHRMGVGQSHGTGLGV